MTVTVKYLNYSGTDFCPLKPEIARFSIGFRLNSLTQHDTWSNNLLETVTQFLLY